MEKKLAASIMDVAKRDAVQRDTAVSMHTIKQMDQLIKHRCLTGQGRTGQGRAGQEGNGREGRRLLGGQPKHQGAVVSACQPTLT